MRCSCNPGHDHYTSLHHKRRTTPHAEPSDQGTTPRCGCRTKRFAETISAPQRGGDSPLGVCRRRRPPGVRPSGPRDPAWPLCMRTTALTDAKWCTIGALTVFGRQLILIVITERGRTTAECCRDAVAISDSSLLVRSTSYATIQVAAVQLNPTLWRRLGRKWPATMTPLDWALAAGNRLPVAWLMSPALAPIVAAVWETLEISAASLSA